LIGCTWFILHNLYFELCALVEQINITPKKEKAQFNKTSSWILRLILENWTNGLIRNQEPDNTGQLMLFPITTQQTLVWVDLLFYSIQVEIPIFDGSGKRKAAGSKNLCVSWLLDSNTILCYVVMHPCGSNCFWTLNDRDCLKLKADLVPRPQPLVAYHVGLWETNNKQPGLQ
jgi:hypothetical protein